MPKLKHSDIKNKNKILLDVSWDHLKGNAKPYLSVGIQQVIFEGKRIHGWQEQKEAIRKLNSNFSFLVDCHLCSPDGFTLHMVSNGIYHFEQMKDHIINDKNSKQYYRDLLAEKYKTTLAKWISFEKTFTPANRQGSCQGSFYNAFIEMLNNPYKQIKPFTDQLPKLVDKKPYRVVSIEERIKMITKAIEDYRINKKTLESSIKNAPDRIYTLENFASLSGLEVQQVKDLFFDKDYKNTLTKIFTKQAEINEKKLAMLTKQYNIETVVK